MNQTELADAAGIPLRTLKAWEKEKQPVSLGVALRIAAALEVSLDQLAGVPDPQIPAPREPEVIVDGVLYVPASAASSGQPSPAEALEKAAAKASDRAGGGAGRAPRSQRPRR